MIEWLPKKESQSLLVGYTHGQPRSTTFPLESGGKKPSNYVDLQGLVIEGKLATIRYFKRTCTVSAFIMFTGFILRNLERARAEINLCRKTKTE